MALQPLRSSGAGNRLPRMLQPPGLASLVAVKRAAWLPALTWSAACTNSCEQPGRSALEPPELSCRAWTLGSAPITATDQSGVEQAFNVPATSARGGTAR